MWSMLLITQDQPEGIIELSFHLFSEFLMAVLCITGGYYLLARKPIGKQINLIGLGLISYSVLNAAGYYGQNNDYSMMVMFIILFLFTTLSLILLINLKDD